MCQPQVVLVRVSVVEFVLHVATSIFHREVVFKEEGMILQFR